jgi:hypothetical protein
VGDNDFASKSTWKVDVHLRAPPLDRELQRRDQLVESVDASVRLPLLGSRILDLEGPIGRPKLPRCFSSTPGRCVIVSNGVVVHVVILLNLDALDVGAPVVEPPCHGNAALRTIDGAA